MTKYKLDPVSEARHFNMSRVKSENTKLELRLRQLLLSMGYRGYRIHYTELPGKPDVVFTKRRKVIFAHGCFWHRHNCRAGKSMPGVNRGFWEAKWEYNIKRDKKCLRQIRKAGWKVMIVWECQFRDTERIRRRLAKFLE